MADLLGDARELGLAVVVVTHDSAPWLPAFFETWDRAVRETAIRPEEIAMLVADSGSADQAWDQTARLAQERPQTAILQCGNFGYGAAANRGVHALPPGAKWILLCNPDLTFPADFLLQITVVLCALAAAPTPPPACIGPQLLNADGTVQPSVGHYPTIRGILCDQFRPREHRKYVVPQPAVCSAIDWLSGACLLLNRQAFDKVGGFDERYFLYVEEVDLQRRMKEAGYAIRFEPAVKVTHHAPNAARAVTPAVQRWSARGLLRYFAKFGGWWRLRAYGLLAFASGRLPAREAFSSRNSIVQRSTAA